MCDSSLVCLLLLFFVAIAAEVDSGHSIVSVCDSSWFFLFVFVVAAIVAELTAGIVLSVCVIHRVCVLCVCVFFVCYRG